jgi:acyl dehydratase
MSHTPTGASYLTDYDTQDSAVRFKEQTYAVESQTPEITDAALDAERERFGIEYRGAQATIEVTRDVIRDYCNYMGSSHPLFLDPNVAQTSRWGGIIAPPVMVGNAIIAPGLRGVQWIYAGTSWDFLGVMRPGDVITQRGWYTDAQEKNGRVVARMVLQIGETECTNQKGEVVARSKVYCMRTPRRKAGGGMGYQPRRRHWTAEEVAQLEKAILSEPGPRVEPRYWEEVAEGEEMPTLTYGPLRDVDIAFTGSYTDSGAFSAEAVAHAGAHVYQLLNRRRHPADAYFDPERGIQDHPHRGHWEQFMAQEVGMPGVYDIGPHRLSWLCRHATDWMGCDGFLKHLEGNLRRPNVVSDVTRITGRITKKWLDGAEALVECELSAVNQEGEETMPGRAVLSLPRRN